MLFNTKLSRWALLSLVATSTLTSLGILSSLTSPTVAQVNQCVGIEPDTQVTPINQLSPEAQPFLQKAQQELQSRNINAQLQSFNTEQEDVGTVYEFQAEGSDGCGIEVDIIGTGSGQLEEIEQEITSAQVPQPVTNTLQQQGITATFIERSTRANGSVVYEFEGTNAQGQPVEIDIAESGTVVLAPTAQEPAPSPSPSPSPAQ